MCLGCCAFGGYFIKTKQEAAKQARDEAVAEKKKKKLAKIMSSSESTADMTTERDLEMGAITRENEPQPRAQRVPDPIPPQQIRVPLHQIASGSISLAEAVNSHNQTHPQVLLPRDSVHANTNAIRYVDSPSERHSPPSNLVESSARSRTNGRNEEAVPSSVVNVIAKSLNRLNDQLAREEERKRRATWTIPEADEISESSDASISISSLDHGRRRRSAGTQRISKILSNNERTKSVNFCPLSTIFSEEENDHESMNTSSNDADDETSLMAGSVNSSSSRSSVIGSLGNGKLIEVFSTGGPLGLILDHPDDGWPAIHGIKEQTSAVFEEIQVGDRLLSINKLDVRKLTTMQLHSLMNENTDGVSRITVYRSITASSF